MADKIYRIRRAGPALLAAVGFMNFFPALLALVVNFVKVGRVDIAISALLQAVAGALMFVCGVVVYVDNKGWAKRLIPLIVIVMLGSLLEGGYFVVAESDYGYFYGKIAFHVIPLILAALLLRSLRSRD